MSKSTSNIYKSIPKSEALEACQVCTKTHKRLCPFKNEIEQGSEEIQDPPECVCAIRTQCFHEGDSTQTAEKESPQTPNAVFSRGRQHTNAQKKEPKESQQILNAHFNKIRNGKTHKNAQSKKENYALSGRSEVTPSKLTKTESRYIKEYISKGITDKNKIAYLQGCHVRIVQQTFKNLQKKGAINQYNEIVRFVEGYNAQPERTSGVMQVATEKPAHTETPKQPHAEGGAGHEKVKRLHGWQVLVGILHATKEYYIKHVNSVTRIEGNHISFNRGVIQIGGVKDFENNDPKIAFMDLVPYVFHLLNVIENDKYGLTLVKERKANIKFVKAGEYGEVGNEIAIQAREEGDKIKVVGDDGKVWFICDNSWNLDEAETVHAQEALRDCDIVTGFFNDLRAHPTLPYQSEVWKIVAQIANLTRDATAHVEGMANFLKKQQENQANTEKQQELKTELSMDDERHIYG